MYLYRKRNLWNYQIVVRWPNFMQILKKDLVEALPLINEDIYTVPKYHYFNRKAAYAFATRFYLFYTHADKSNYTKAINCANVVLGEGDPANLLLSPILSVWGYAHGPYSGRNRRYGNANTLFAREGPQAAGSWGTYSNLCTVGKLFGLSQKHGSFI